MDLGMEGRVVLVTGGSSGVGLATVTRLLGEGAGVATCARDLDRLRASVGSLDASRLSLSACDVTVRDDVERFVAEANAKFGRIDGLVCNAGRSRMSGLEDTSAADWREELELKFGSVLHPLHAALPALRRSSEAAVVIVNAVLARQPEPGLMATSAARAGLLNLARSLASELAPAVRVNSVLLGLIDTGQWRRRYEQSGSEQSFERWASAIAKDRGVAMGRLGRSNEVASMIAVLLSSVSSYVTGATLDVSGGVGRYV